MLIGFRSGSFLQADLLSSYFSVSSARPLRSTGVTPLLRYYGPHRLPADAVSRLCIPAKRWLRFRPHTAGSPGFLNESVPARCPHLPRKARQCTAPVTSSPVAGFTIFGRLAVLRLSVTRPNRFNCFTARRFALRGFVSPDCSDARSRSYMLNG